MSAMAVPQNNSAKQYFENSGKRKTLHDAAAHEGGVSLSAPAGSKISDIYANGASPKKKRKTTVQAEPGERRTRKWRSKPPLSYQEIYQRSVSQTFYVIDRIRGGSPDCPSENVEIVGTTGNKYEVHIGLEPSCSCPHAKKGNQCKHIVYVLCRTLKAPANLRYQLAFVPSELVQIFAQAPPILSGQASDDHGNRKPIQDDCPICCMEFDGEHEDIVFCKASCGNNLHKTCFEQWAASKRTGLATVTCPFCRSPWQGDADFLKRIVSMGKRNAEGYVNVAHELGISNYRDYSVYHPAWVRRHRQLGHIDIDLDDE